jgi:hypothetical protein
MGVFTLCEDQDQKKFTEELSDLLKSYQSISLIMTMRADFYDHLIRSDLVEYLQTGHFLVTPMNEKELKEAISKPAEKVGLEIQTGLENVIIKDLTESTTENPLPLLEFTLSQLWEMRSNNVLTHEDYRTIKGVTGAIGKWAKLNVQ